MKEPFYQVDPSEKKRDPMLLTYARVSTAEQASSNRTSMKEQTRVMHGYAMMKGIADFDTAAFTDPGVSGATPVSERPGGKELLATVRTGDTVVASKLDRMFRSAIDALQVAQNFKKRGINLVLLDMGDQPVTSNGMAECFFQMAAAFAQLERVRIAERMEDGRRAKADRGGCIGHTPYGWTKVGTRHAAMLEPNLEEQGVMMQVLKWSRNHSATDIANMLESSNTMTRSGKPWQAVQIIRMRQHARKL